MRLTRGLAKSAFADLVGVPASTITRIEAGQVEPTWQMLQRIAEGAGLDLEADLHDLADDARYAAALDGIAGTQGSEKRKRVRKLSGVAALAPVMKRSGVKSFELDRPLSDVVARWEEAGLHPIVSSLEAVEGDVASGASFIPVVYLDDPAAAGLAPARPASGSVVAVLPSTEHVRRYSQRLRGTMMATVEWGIMDALASPGRQADIAREYLPILADRSA
ncbi:helix-turn-helix domain-containing protein [Agromyces archimandritae]|uniref:Helix-turn-helix transcriptional regulator n=1 Tax=Agromyces archimandritae TaxID=2781962 RepID=A0A975FK19_9MICO|nr:helix-turn-helix transcriptional regulator [Agromyces archimandritae]QTX03475.1 helix-turn-helix transcriptional regulator [Agromyces archimandritae]